MAVRPTDIDEEFVFVALFARYGESKRGDAD